MAKLANMEKETLYRIRETMKSAGIGNEELAERIGAHPITVSKLLNDRMRMTTAWLEKIARALNTDASSFMQPGTIAPPRSAKQESAPANLIPVYGLAAGSLAGHAVMLPEPVEFVACPPTLVTVRDAYALMVKGTSMEPRYFAGDLLFMHPHKPVRPGDHVVVQVRREGANGHTETWVKRYKGESETDIITEQYNPKADMRFKRQYVAAMHRVMTSNELLGV